MSKQGKRAIPVWQNKKLSNYERMVMETAWENMIEEGKVTFGSKPPIAKNVQALCKAMAAADSSI